MKLHPFDAKAKCPKCGHNKIACRYEGPIEQDPCRYGRKYNPPNKWPEHEYMHRTCERCRHAWPESVLSKKVA